MDIITPEIYKKKHWGIPVVISYRSPYSPPENVTKQLKRKALHHCIPVRRALPRENR